MRRIKKNRVAIKKKRPRCLFVVCVANSFTPLSPAIFAIQVLGDYPSDLSEDGAQNIGRGRLIPTSPWEAVWNAVAGW